MNTEEFKELSDLTEKMEHLKKAEGKAISNLRDVIRLQREVSEMPGYPDAVPEEQRKHYAELSEKAAVFVG